MNELDELAAWNAEALQVLIRRDIKRFAEMCEEGGAPPSSSLAVTVVAFHKARARHPDIPADLRHKSRIWLLKRKYSV